MIDEDLKKILEKNSQDIDELKGMVKSIKNYFLWQRIYQIIMILTIVVPIVVAYFLVGPMLKGLLENGLGAITGNVDMNNLSPELLKQFNISGQ